MHQNLPKQKLIDIAMTINNLVHLGDEEKMLKIIKRVQMHIEVTNEKILSAGQPNLKGIMRLYYHFAEMRQGSV